MNNFIENNNNNNNDQDENIISIVQTDNVQIDKNDNNESSNLEYFDKINKDLLSSPTGGILIMSQGTGVYKVIGEYLDNFDKGSQTIFFLLNFDNNDKLKSEMNEIQYYTKNHNIVDITDLISAKRKEIYNKGGVFFVTQLVLLNDLLSGNIIHSERITGFIINKIQTVRDYKEDLVWLTTLLKTNNPSAIVLGICECEQTLANRGLENIMRWFYMARCFVWNMIRAEVQNDIVQKTNVCEYLDSCVDMNKRMKTIDNCIKVIIILILKQLKSKSKPSDLIEYPIFQEEEFFNSNYYILIDKIKSNKLFYKAYKNNFQYFEDAFTFKQLQQDLFQMNCVQFYSKLLSIERNSNEDSFINRTIEDPKSKKVIEELFDNTKKRVYEMQKIDNPISISIQESKLKPQLTIQQLQNSLINPQQRQQNNFNSFKMIAEKSNSIRLDNKDQNSKSLNELNSEKFNLQQENSQDISKSQSINSKEQKFEKMNNSSQEQMSQDSIIQFIQQKQFEETSSEKENESIKKNSIENINKQISPIEENKRESEDEEIQLKNSKISSDDNILKQSDVIEEVEEQINEEEEKLKEEKLNQQICFINNLIDQNPDSLFLSNKQNTMDQEKYLFIDSDDEEKSLKFEVNYKIKLNLDIDPKFKCLSVILNEINEKYKNQLPINGDKFLIWIHTNDSSRVPSIQEFIQNTFLKNDPNNKLSLMKRYRYLLNLQIEKRHSYLLDLIKKKGQGQLSDKKDSEIILLESLYKELDLLFQVIEYEQLDLNKNTTNNLQYPKNCLFESQVLQQISSEKKFKDSKMDDDQNDEEEIPTSKPKDSKNYVLISSQSQENFIRLSTGNNTKKRSLQEKDIIPEVRKRKLFIDDKVGKKFKLIDVNSMNVNIIDELNETGNVQFLSKQIMPNFEFIVNSTNKSVIRQNFIRAYRPNFIILFEPNINIIREVTIYQHLITVNKVNPIYELRTIMFNKSAESERTLYKTIQENVATERIIKEKNSMATSIEDPVLRVKNITKKANTRIGGQSLQLQPTIIIDKREFRSDLPTILFHEGYKIVPIQLSTGDYIISKDIAIERKSVETPDLVNSLRSGRLYLQLVAMTKAYKKCYLLIEFSESMPFNLESINYNVSFGNEQDQQENNRNKPKTNPITFYLPLLVSQFDNLKIIWSKGPLHTSKIFLMLKQNQLEPNIQDFIKEQDKKEKKESIIDQYVQANQDEEKYQPADNTLFKYIKPTEDNN